MLRYLAWLFGTFCLLVLLIAGALYYGYSQFIGPGPSTAETTVVVPRGSKLGDIGALLEKAGVIRNAQLFELGARIYAVGHGLQAGEYDFPAAASQQQVVDMMAAGRTVVRRLTVPEGLTVPEILELVRGAPGLDGDPPDPEAVAEGTLMPETYFYSWGDGRKAMVERMGAAMRKEMAELWAGRAAKLGVDTPKAAVVLASIVEKETAVPAERPRIAAVFYNRLARGMKLQSDPTVIYALTDGKGPLGRPLTHADLDTASPYNTYLNAGLPPAPIGNPGRASLEAVLHPADTRELYFVADGTGGHAFAATLEEHNRNVARWRKLAPAAGATAPAAGAPAAATSP
ncbi:MAG: endolytic transglycosylase MltG [Dongiaceae bacterium]